MYLVQIVKRPDLVYLLDVSIAMSICIITAWFNSSPQLQTYKRYKLMQGQSYILIIQHAIQGEYYEYRRSSDDMQQGEQQEEDRHTHTHNMYISINFYIHWKWSWLRRPLNVYSGSGYPCIHLIKWAHFISLEGNERFVSLQNRRSTIYFLLYYNTSSYNLLLRKL